MQADNGSCLHRGGDYTDHEQQIDGKNTPHAPLPQKSPRFRLSYKSCRMSRSPDHFATEIRAPTALFRAWTAHGMLRRMALAHLGTLVANLRAEPAQRLGSL